MAHRVGMEVSIAVSHAVQLARAEAIAAYPITPQTHIVEHLSTHGGQRRIGRRIRQRGVGTLGHERLHRHVRQPAPAPTPPPAPRAWP